MLTGILISPALGWSVLRTIRSSIAPAAVPGGMITVILYRPFCVLLSSGVISTLIFSGWYATVNFVGVPPRTSSVDSRVAPWLLDTFGMRTRSGMTLIGPVVVAGDRQLELRLRRMVGLDHELVLKSPQRHSRFQLYDQPQAAFDLELLAIFGRQWLRSWPRETRDAT